MMLKVWEQLIKIKRSRVQIKLLRVIQPSRKLGYLGKGNINPSKKISFRSLHFLVASLRYLTGYLTAKYLTPLQNSNFGTGFASR